jgi:ubiquinone/menaquinone biosynthesis C-methylase UbiE
MLRSYAAVTAYDHSLCKAVPIFSRFERSRPRKLVAMADQPNRRYGPIDVPRLGEIYSRTAAFYDGLVAADQSKAKDAAIALLARRPGETFLEAGAGTGWAFARIVGASGRDGAVAVDVAAGMLDVAALRLKEEARLSHPPLVLADARRLPFRDACFDCILTTYTLEVLPQDAIGSVLSDCHRVLRPGGRIVVLNLTDGEGADAAFTDDWKRRYAVDPERFGGARPIRAVPALQAAGFIAIARRYHGPDWPSELLRGVRPHT